MVGTTTIGDVVGATVVEDVVDVTAELLVADVDVVDVDVAVVDSGLSLDDESPHAAVSRPTAISPATTLPNDFGFDEPLRRGAGCWQGDD